MNLVRLIAAAAFASIVPTAPSMAGPSILIDAGTGEVLGHDQAFQRWYPASLTKLMTIYVTFRAIQAGELDLRSPIKISRKAANEPPGKMGYKRDQTVTLDNALKMLVVKSANDIATAVAENVGGTEKDFVARMNAEAARLGMTGSHFANAHGLFHPEQYSTARDLAVLGRAIRTEFPLYAGYFTFEALQDGKKEITTNVVLLGRLPGADGMKTGFICASGFNLVGSATRDGRTLISVVLGSPSPEKRAEQAAAALAEGFGRIGKGPATLATLAPYGADRDSATDLRETICTKEASDERWAQRDADGKPVYHSPYLATIQHAPRVAVVGVGGANGPVPKARAERESAGYADVPIPTWRPDLPPPVFSAEGDTAELRP